DSKIHAATEGLQPFVLNYFKTIGTIKSTILADYIIAARSESNISDTSRKEIIKDLFTLSKFLISEQMGSAALIILLAYHEKKQVINL
ncbi:MAG: hypothetical protein ACJ706_12040, partial [Nitrososphaeraceae archaeon]